MARTQVDRKKAQLEAEIRFALGMYSDLDRDEAIKVAQAVTEHLIESPVFTSIQR